MNGLLQLASCYDEAGRLDEAFAAYERALKAIPGHPGVLTARGVRTYGRNTPSAVRDLNEAVRHGVDTFWPYFFLAHHYITTGDYSQALAAATAVRAFPSLPVGVRATLHEFIAISQAERGESPVVVRASFQQALEFAPDDERIRANVRMYERALQIAEARRPWRVPEAETVARMALRELALAGAA